MARSPLRQAYVALADKPLGRHVFSAAVALTAPYFRTIRARVVSLEPGRGVATVEDLTALADEESHEVVVPVDLTDPAGQVVVHADITMWVTPATLARAHQAA